MSNFTTRGKENSPFSQAFSLKWHLNFLRIHRVYIQALSINGLLGFFRPDLGGVILGNRVGLRG